MQSISSNKINLEKIDIKNKGFIELIAKWKSDIKLSDLIVSEPVNLSSEEAKKWVVKNSKDSNQVFMGIHYDKRLIGIARLMFIDNSAKTAEIGLYIGTKVSRGKGVGKSVISNLIEIADSELNLNKLYAKVRKSNKASLELFIKMGFVREGLLKYHYKSRLTGDFDDIVHLAKYL